MTPLTGSRHVPRKHAIHTKHSPTIKCGCALSLEQKNTIACPSCGALYDWFEVQEFSVWTCYDCLAGWRTRDAL